MEKNEIYELSRQKCKNLTEDGAVVLRDELLVLLQVGDLLGGRAGLAAHELGDSDVVAGSVVVLQKKTVMKVTETRSDMFSRS